VCEDGLLLLLKLDLWQVSGSICFVDLLLLFFRKWGYFIIKDKSTMKIFQ